MTTEERFERIEHVTAGIAEERRKDREEYKTLWRDLATKTESIARNVDALAIDTRLRFDQVADRFDQLGDRIDKLATEAHAQNKALGERIDQMVSAIGEMLRNGKA
jgi:hypothetical protein